MATSEFIQGYKENGEVGDPITLEQAAAGALHGTSHVWIWRGSHETIEILLQKRNGRTWPGYWDISTAGHIDAGETPLVTAAREASEEIGIEIDKDQLSLVGVYRWCQQAVTRDKDDRIIENEFQWAYAYHAEDLQGQQLQYEASEVETTTWVSKKEFVELIDGKSKMGHIIDHDSEYYNALLRYIDTQARQ